MNQRKNDMVICEQSEKCEARGYCFHASEHEEIKNCTEKYVCDFSEIDVQCIEVRK